MTTLKPGDEVRVIPLYGDDRAPADGWVAYVSGVREAELGSGEYDARPVAWGDERRGHLTFSIADNRSTDSGGQYLAVTPEYAERRRRRNAALAVLKENCITLEPGHCLSVEEIEALAAVAETFGQEG